MEGIKGEELKINRSDLIRVLEGVFIATKASHDDGTLLSQQVVSLVVRESPDADQSVSQKTSSQTSLGAYDLNSWRVAAEEIAFKDEDLRQTFNLALAVAFLRTKSRKGEDVQPDELSTVWNLIYNTLISLMLSRPLCSVSRSAQGFLAVPLCSLIRDGNIEELFRFHIWLPDGQRGNPDFAVHSHQPWAQSWILAGEGEDRIYDVQPVSDHNDATHAEYMLAWTDSKGQSTAYKTHQVSSTVVNAQRYFHVTQAKSEIHSRDMSYTAPAATFHSSVIAPDGLHATLFFFDSSRGFVQSAGVLGPREGQSFTQFRDPAGVTAEALANIVNNVRSWEQNMSQGRYYAAKAQWEQALQAFNSALNLCNLLPDHLDATRYRAEVLGALGNTNRRFGRYDLAKDYLETALTGLEPSALKIELSGELGVIYRHRNNLSDAKRVSEDQYEMAKQLGFPKETCRAIGTLGMVNYQLSLQTEDQVLLDSAIQQLVERVSSARHLNHGPWLIVGLCRLSLCYTAKGKLKQAIEVASEALDLTETATDPTVIAMTRWFYGRALIRNGQRAEALRQFNQPNTCTPAIAMCKEPSDEHREYLRELIDVGANLELVDKNGYSALDYAVFNSDSTTEQIVIDGLRRQYDILISKRQADARLRKGYRELFQEKLRPVFLRNKGKTGKGLEELRHVYAEELAVDEAKTQMFDGLKYLHFIDFLESKRLPRSSEGLAREYLLNTSSGQNSVNFIIFFSYRWINKTPGSLTPDDENDTQYRRMLGAIDEFLRKHPDVDRKKLGLWIDQTCVDQDNPGAGVAALPMIIAQCDAMITLYDNDYYERAWCSVEAIMVRILKKSYNMHLWYEQVLAEGERDVAVGNINGQLIPGPMDIEIVMADKRLTYEGDRPTVLFLERQSHLLG